MPIIEGGLGPYTSAGAPVGGTDEVQTLTFGGTWIEGEVFRLSFAGYTTANIAWSATDATLVANIDAALEALPPIGTGGVAVADATLTSGLGTATVTFSGANLAKRAQALIAVAYNASEDGTLGVAETTPGVGATAIGAAKGAILVDTTNAKLYINTGTAAAPTWTVAGTQS
jgi:hypothetical protein